MTDPNVELAELAGSFIHEIKNHLGTLGLNLQILTEDLSEPASQAEKRALERAHRLQRECDRLVDLSNDFLRFARIRDLDLTLCDLEVLLEELCDFFLPTANLHKVTTKLYIPTDLPQLKLDEELFKQAILNLLLNAQQAMVDGGEITLQARQDGGMICLSVIDTGKGMTADVQKKIFKPFYSRRQGGTGLGLPTTRRIIEAHQGTLEVQSDPGRGSCFTIRLPVKS